MKYLPSSAAALCVAMILTSCNHYESQSRKANVQEVQLSDLNASETMATDSSAVASDLLPPQPERRFIRSAELSFKVNDVLATVQFIENKTRSIGGFVTNSSIRNLIYDSISNTVSKDSMMQILHYTTTGFLTIRVPDERLDSMLGLLNPLSVLLVKREIHAEDVSLQLLANQWTTRRAVNHNNRLVNAIHRNGKKLSEIMPAEGAIDDRNQTADEARISSLTLEDGIKFSTISLNIYQDPVINYKETARERKMPEYETPFFSQIGESLREGWVILKFLIVSLCKLWSLLLIVLTGYFIFLKYFLSGKKVKPGNY